MTLQPALTLLTKLGESVLVFVGVEQLLQSETKLELAVITFGLLVVLSDVAIWSYKNIVKPSSVAIVKSSK